MTDVRIMPDTVIPTGLGKYSPGRRTFWENCWLPQRKEKVLSSRGCLPQSIVLSRAPRCHLQLAPWVTKPSNCPEASSPMGRWVSASTASLLETRLGLNHCLIWISEDKHRSKLMICSWFRDECAGLGAPFRPHPSLPRACRLQRGATSSFPLLRWQNTLPC